MLPRAIIFDFDGTILDTETCDFRRWEALYRTHGLSLALADWQVGVGTWDAFDPWAALPDEVRARKDEVKLALREQILADLEAADLRPGVRAVLHEAVEAGVRLAVASSSDRAWVTRWLVRHGLLGRFDALVTRDDVTHVKPHPEPYATAVARLRLRPAECVAIEDSFHGATSAHAAGLRVVVVPNEVTASQPFLAEWSRRQGFSTLTDLLG